MRKDNEEALPLFHSYGVDCAEVFLTSFYQYEEAYGKLLQGKKGNISVNSVHDLTSQFEPQLFNRHAGVRADAYKILGKVLGVAEQLSAPYYTFHGTTRAKKASRLGGEDFSSLIADFQEISSFCQERGISLCLENVEWSTYNRPSVFSKIAEGVPTLRGVLDIKQARLSGYPYEEYLQEMGERLAYVHLSDVTAEGKMCLPGRGIFDFPTLFKRLKDIGFDGALLVEAYEKDYNEEIELKYAYEYLKELADE